jgi:hypothetical protein
MFGFAISTPAFGPYLTLNVTETLLYGFVGQFRYISLFQAALSYYFDSTGNVGVTAQYKNGRDEDTAEYAQTYTIGLAVKFNPFQHGSDLPTRPFQGLPVLSLRDHLAFSAP